jgi:hypothetical protein
VESTLDDESNDGMVNGDESSDDESNDGMVNGDESSDDEEDDSLSITLSWRRRGHGSPA